MPDFSAGTASIRITPDATSFLRDLEAKIRSMRDPRFSIRVEADTDAAQRDTNAFRQEQERRGVNVNIDADTAGASADMARWRATQENNDLNIKVNVDVSRAGAQLDGLNRRLESLGRSDLLRLNVGAGILAGIQPALTGLAQVAAAIQQVSQAGLALPGVFAGAASSIGTLVLGLSGIKDAYDAVSDAAASSGRDQAAQAQAAVSASNNLRNAVVDEARAREDVARATRRSAQELRDLRTEQRGGMIDESRAILEARQAREDLAKGNYSDIRDQLLTIAEADQRVIEVRNRNATTAERLNEINRTGVQGTDEVRDANERLIRTQQAVAEAQLAAAQAASTNGSAQDKAAEAMAKLGPNAREVVDTMVRLTPAFEDFRAKISDPLLEGKAQEFENFFTSVRPVAERGLAGIAAGWNQNISAFLGAVGSERGQGLIDRILGNTGDAQARLSNAMDPLVEGIGTLTAAGTDVLPRLADGFASVMDRFRDFIVAADEDGRLDKWINDGIDGARMLGESMLNIGKSITAVTNAIGGGRSFLQWLQDATGRLQTFLNSAEGQNKLREYFDQGREMLAQLMPLLQELPGAFSAIGEGATTYVGGMLLPVLKTVADLLGEHPQLVSTAVAAWLTWKTVGPVVSGVQSGINLLNTGLIGIGTNFASTRAKVEGEMSRVNKAFDDAGKPNSKLGTFTSRIAGLGAVGGPLGVLAATAIPGVIGALELLDAKNEESATKVRNFESDVRTLEATLDRTTGKVTELTRTQLIEGARNVDTAGEPGGGIPGISQGNALQAATSLGIPPDVYADALAGDPAAAQKVRDIALKNNLIPEFAANKSLTADAGYLQNITGGKITQDLLLNALIGDPKAVEEYTKAFEEASRSATDEQAARLAELDLANIAQRLSPTGKASVFSTGHLNRTLGRLPAAQQGAVEQSQAEQGRYRLTPAGTGFFGQGTTVGRDGDKIKISTPPGPPGPGLMAALQMSQLPYVVNPDKSVTITVPADSPYIEKYAQGGPTPGPRNKGFLAELHGEEWVHDADTVATYGRDVMNAMWRKQIDPKALKGLLPGFWLGGPTDPNDPNYVGIATGQTASGPAPGPAMTTTHGAGATPGPVAPNPFDATQPGAINNIAGQAVAGAADPLSSLSGSLLSGFGINLPGQQQSSGASEPALTPGLWGLIEAGNDPLKQQQWQKQTLDWLVKDWVGGTIVSGLMGSVLPNVLDAIGLGGILNSPYVSAFTKTLDHFMSMGDPQEQSNAAMTGTVTLPDGSQIPVEQFLTPTANGAGTTAAAVPGTGFAAADPYGLDAGSAISYGAEGFPQWVYDLAEQYGVEASTYSGHQEGSGQNRGIDWRPKGLAWDSPEGAAVMERFAQALQNAPGVEQIIFENAVTGSRVGRDPGDRGPDQTIDDYYRDDWAGHRDHVHTRFGNAIIAVDPAGGTAPVAGSTGFASFLKQLYGGGAGPGVTPTIGASTAGTTGLKSTAQQMYLAAGLPSAEWAAFDELIRRESAWSPTAKNPNSTAYGLGQFLDTTWDDVGGSRTDDPVKQLDYIFKYLKQRYNGSPAQALAFHDANNWYLRGGHTPGSPSTPIPAILHGDEFVHRNEAVEKYGLDFMHAINEGRIDPALLPGFRKGGTPTPAQIQAAKAVARKIDPRPPRPPDARQMKPTGPERDPMDMLPGSARPAAPGTPVSPPQPAPAPAPPPPVAVQPPAAKAPTFAPAPAEGGDGVAPAGPTDYTLPWVNQAIESGAAAIGSAVQTAAVAAGTMGMGAAAAGGMGGMGGISIQGLFQQGGKIVQGVANVISGAMVGSVPGSFMTTPEVYGRTLRPEQNTPQTAMPPYSSGPVQYGPFYGHDTQSVMQEISLHESINAQAPLANHPGRV